MLKNLIMAVLIAAGGMNAAVAADAEAGKAQYTPCVACHGANAEGNPALNAPALAGQHAAYLTRQIQHFQQGVRGGEPRDTLGRQMQGMAAVLGSPEAVADVVAFIATQPVPQTAAIDYDKRNGEVQYNASCGACHGAKAQGNPSLNAPNLAILDEAYLRRQYTNFGEGIRGAHPQDKYGRQMAMMASMLASEKDVNDVIGFILAQ